MKKHQTIYLLIGKKGSGKTFIGGLFEKYFRVPFIRVEDWAIRVKRDRRTDDEDYIREVFVEIEKGIRRFLESADAVVFESTGLGRDFERMYQNLALSFQMITIRIVAGSELCLSRVQSRDQEIHVDISDEQVMKINDAVEQRNFPCDYIIENSTSTEAELIRMIGQILGDPR